MNFTNIDIEKTLRKRKPTGKDVGKLFLINRVTEMCSFFKGNYDANNLYDGKRYANLINKISIRDDADYHFFIRQVYVDVANILKTMVNTCFTCLFDLELGYEKHNKNSESNKGIDEFLKIFLPAIESEVSKIVDNQTCIEILFKAIDLECLFGMIEEIIGNLRNSVAHITISFIEKNITNDARLIAKAKKRVSSISIEKDAEKSKRIEKVTRYICKNIFEDDAIEMLSSFFERSYVFIRFGKGSYDQ